MSIPKDQLRRGDRVSYGDHEYIVANTTREGKLRLLGTDPTAPVVPRLLAPTRVKVVALGPRLPSPTRRATDRDRIVATGEMLREVRETLGFTTRRLADIIGVNSSYLSRAETGKHHSVPSAGYLQRFSEVTGADEDLLCATAGIVPKQIAAALTDVEKLRAVRLLLAKLER